MVVVFGMAAGLWFFGRAIGAPFNARALMLGLLYVAVLAAHIALPDGHPLHGVLGGSAANWLIMGALSLAVWAYWMGLHQLRAFVRPENRPKSEEERSAPTRLERAARHIALREIGGAGQARIETARVLVVGAGGLGSPALQYLAASGVGTLGLIDGDTVELSNLQRQTIHTDHRIGMPKVFSAEAAIHEQNPFVVTRPYNRRLTEDIAHDLFEDYDLILDATDDTATRYLINRTAVEKSIPLITGAISQWDGQVSVHDPARGTACYACLFPVEADPERSATCAEAGVAAPLPGVIGTMMALEAIKILSGAGEALWGKMALYDGLTGETRTVALTRTTDCPVCGTKSRSVSA
ncbi:MAG: HesA/MoeB/ThiF family protein [Pseudomonadota bacterium]